MTLLVGAIIALTGLSVAPLAATAATTTESGITDVTIRERNLDTWSWFHVDVAWTASDSAVAGDTFTLDLPPEIVALTESFDLVSAGGEIVARATVAGSVVTFTLTEFADEHIEVTGTAYFEAEFVPERIVPGARNELVFGTDTGPIEVGVDIGLEYTDNTEPRKYGYWVDSVDQGNTTPSGALRWRIVTPVGPFETVTIEDRIASGHRLDCDGLTVRALTAFAPNGDVTASEPLAADRYTLESCDASGFVLTTGAIAVGQAVAVDYTTTVTDASLTDYLNEATITANGESRVLGSVVQRSEAGGDGVGVPTPVDPTDPPTDPTDPPTDPTDPPTDPTDPPTEPTDPTDPPTDPTDPPTEPTDPTEPPTEPTLPPAEPTTEPGVDPSTDAPPSGGSGDRATAELPHTGASSQALVGGAGLAAAAIVAGLALLLVGRRARLTN
ncbi:Ig-like domain-containing protein [Occultella kanbiaonis]|uniref:Ig-like domain-containing protein n=1 Tax=Occultella kanbiaonis TaxID=2675754 RepID=UPI0013D03BF5|nr:Ig-like domain-containing protein [Occultella kanbiaonis]